MSRTILSGGKIYIKKADIVKDLQNTYNNIYIQLNQDPEDNN